MAALMSLAALVVPPTAGTSGEPQHFLARLGGHSVLAGSGSGPGPDKDGCRTTYSFGGVGETIFASNRASVVTITAASDAEPARVARGRIDSLSASASGGGSANERQDCANGGGATHADCFGTSVPLPPTRTTLSLPAPRTAALSPLRDVPEPKAFCFRDPTPPGGHNLGVDVAPAELDEAGLFDPSVRFVVVRGNYRRTTPLTDPYPGEMVEKVVWTLTLERVSAATARRYERNTRAASRRPPLHVVLFHEARTRLVGARPVYRYTRAGLRGYAAYLSERQVARLRRETGASIFAGPSLYAFELAAQHAECASAASAAMELGVRHRFVPIAEANSTRCSVWRTALTARQLYLLSRDAAIGRMYPPRQ